MSQYLPILGRLMVISASFAVIHDASAQIAEMCIERKKHHEQEQEEEAEKKRLDGDDNDEETVHLDNSNNSTECSYYLHGYDYPRSGRYALVHALWNAPTHLPRLLALNALFPGPITVTVVLGKLLVNELIFSPIESLGVLVFVQSARDGNTSNVGAKLHADFVPYQLAKYAGHIPAHILMFALTSSIERMMFVNYLVKFLTEIVQSHVVNRPPPPLVQHNEVEIVEGEEEEEEEEDTKK
eukprot:PhM_4_TR14315/c0_g2_i1/m.102971